MARKTREKKTEDKKLQDYELVYIIRPDTPNEVLETKVNSINDFITGHEGVVADVQNWGKKKLAYPIKRFLEGNYILTRFKISPARCKELEANLRVSEEIIRHLLVKVES